MTIRTLVPALVLAAAAVAPATSNAQLSANIGWVSEYIYRGIFQEDSSASAGIDYENSGFYIGTWGADVGDGLETDLYFGYSGGEDFTYTIGFTGYYYTDDFDDTYQEINLGIGYKLFALDVAIGEYDNFGQGKLDYTFTSITISPEKGPYFKVGSFGDDFDGEYFELGYTYSIEEHGVDLGIALINSSDLPVTNPADGETGDSMLTFSITKSISFGN